MSYSPGRLAKRIGIGKSTLIKHLKDNGLFSRCYRDKNGWLRIPYDVAIEIAGPEALTVKMPKRRSPARAQKKKAEMDDFMKEIMGEEGVDYEILPNRPPNFSKPTSEQIAREKVEKRFQYYRNLAVQMLRIGITPQMYFDWCKKQQQGGIHESKPEETKTNEP